MGCWYLKVSQISVKIDQFRYIQIQPNTIDLSTRLWGINPTNSVVIPQSLVLRSIFLRWISVYHNWSIFSAFLCNHEFCRYHLSIKTTELFLGCKFKLWHAFPSSLSAKSPCWASKSLSREVLVTNSKDTFKITLWHICHYVIQILTWISLGRMGAHQCCCV